MGLAGLFGAWRHTRHEDRPYPARGPRNRARGLTLPLFQPRLAGIEPILAGRGIVASCQSSRCRLIKRTPDHRPGASQATHAENAHSVLFDRFAAELAAKTNGKIGAMSYGDSQLGPEDKYTAQINCGTLDVMLTGSDWAPIVPELGVDAPAWAQGMA